MNTLQCRINLQMEKLKLTEKALSEKMAGIVSQVTIHKLRTGKQKRTSFIHELADALECDSHWLATGIIVAGGTAIQFEQNIVKAEVPDGSDAVESSRALYDTQEKYPGNLQVLHDLAPNAVRKRWLTEEDAEVLVKLMQRLIDLNRSKK